RASRLGWVWAGFGGYRTRARSSSALVGAGSDLEDLQTFFGRGQQAYDSAVQISHIGTDTHGQSVTRGVFQDDARGMSRGLVRIEKEARKTISFLSEHAMLLSRGARSDTIPILEILCRDVKATHSSSVAPVDPEKVFYLESRGMPRGDAVRMISEGFLAHVLSRAPIAGLRELLYPLLEARWAGRDLPWTEGSLPALPRLDFASDVAETDWRFDAKLR
ncbi:MAG TPA: SufD family Fe-S cluster assembly protein, partial [Thermoplasmata archaeon]|nr:SufD family Fe-S cluster assembly protein [Thermoplasmata archaeon]